MRESRLQRLSLTFAERSITPICRQWSKTQLALQRDPDYRKQKQESLRNRNARTALQQPNRYKGNGVHRPYTADVARRGLSSGSRLSLAGAGGAMNDLS